MTRLLKYIIVSTRVEQFIAGHTNYSNIRSLSIPTIRIVKIPIRFSPNYNAVSMIHAYMYKHSHTCAILTVHAYIHIHVHVPSIHSLMIHMIYK